MTERLYLNEEYLVLEAASCVVFIEEVLVQEAKLKGAHVTHKIRLSQTLFHPQGGGQPTDVGYLVDISSGRRFDVLFVSVGENENIVDHFGIFLSGCAASAAVPTATLEGRKETASCTGTDGSAVFTIGCSVSMFVDECTRRYNSRLHSAGHALDAGTTSPGTVTT